MAPAGPCMKASWIAFDAHTAKRIRTTTSTRMTDAIEKIDGAGDVVDIDGRRFQRMHNGILVGAGAYGGEWMTEIISRLGGHHEPQEEVVFDALLGRLASVSEPVMIEFGSNWTYYGMWFATALPGSRVLALEPDRAYLANGKANVEINELGDRVTFIRGAVGDTPGASMDFIGEHGGPAEPVEQHDFASLMGILGTDRVDLALIDIQGFEYGLLLRASDLLRSGAIRFLVVSTHHHSFSGDALTHQRVLQHLRNLGGSIIAEHSIPESFSGDGLIVASFDERDAGFEVDLPLARSRDSIFDSVEFELETAMRELADARARIRELESSRLVRAADALSHGVQRLRRRD